jgi:ribosomal protein S18 acetylase RimI-like enzyme
LSTDVLICPIAEQYIEGFHRCLDAVARERHYLGFLQAPPLASTREFVLFNIKNGIPQFVAVRGSEVVGWCDIVPLTREGFTHGGVLGMGVRKDVRGQGIGSKLIARTLTAAKELGLERVELDVYASNQPAIRLYEKVGFVVEGTRKRARKLDGIYDDLVEMALFF